MSLVGGHSGKNQSEGPRGRAERKATGTVAPALIGGNVKRGWEPPQKTPKEKDRSPAPRRRSQHDL